MEDLKKEGEQILTDAECDQYMKEKIRKAYTRQLIPLKEDVCLWLNELVNVSLATDSFMTELANGIVLCQLVETISNSAYEYIKGHRLDEPIPRLKHSVWKNANIGTFFARENIVNFLEFAAKVGVHKNICFETEDLVQESRDRPVILCLLELARLSYKKWNIKPPNLVTLEQELDCIPRENDSGRYTQSEDDTIKDSIDSPSESSTPLHSEEPLSQLPVDIRRSSASIISSSENNSNVRTPNISRGPVETPKQQNKSVTSNRKLFGHPKRSSVAPETIRRMSLLAISPSHASKKSSYRIVKTPKQSTSKSVSSSPSVSNGVKLTKTPAKSMCSNSVEKIRKDSTNIKQQKTPKTHLREKARMVALETGKICCCTNARCQKSHMKMISDGKYEIYGKIFHVRLLNNAHVMVRIGGGWDTLEHYLLTHVPVTVTEMKDNNLNIRSRYNSPSINKNVLRID